MLLPVFIFMKRIFIILIIYYVGSHFAYGQHCYGENLVPNPSLDEFSICPFNMTQINYAFPWSQPLYQSTSDYFNQCMFDGNPTQLDTAYFGNIHWRSRGMAYLIIWEDWGNPPWREYIEVPLKRQLEAGQCYYGEFWILTHNVSKVGIDAIGMYFSDTLVKVLNYTVIGTDTLNWVIPIYANPQIANPTGHILRDTAQWEKVSGTFTATGTETAMIMGCFKHDNEINYEQITGTPYQSARYFYDDFVLCKCEDTIPPDTIKPIEPQLEVYPNPANNNLFILFNGYDQTQAIELEIFNVLGELVMNKQIISNSEPSSVSTDQLSPGCYILLLRTASKNLYKDRLIIIR